MIAFRVDANEYIATGHLMRCLAIAAELKQRGQQCVFFLAEEKETKRILEQGHSYEILYSRWEQVEQELPVLQTLLKKYKPDWLVVDSYQATNKYLAVLEQQVPVLYVDDMAQNIWEVSMLLHYTDWMDTNVYEKQYMNTKTKLLIGMKYVPLRAEFYPKNISVPANQRNNVLITTGGTDAYNVAGKLLNYIYNKIENPHAENDFLALRDMTYHVIVGSMNQNKKELEQLARHHSQIVLYQNVDNMGDIMRSCDFAVSAGGTTLFELCACQVPTVCFSFAENQEAFAKKMGEKSIMFYAGDPRYGEASFMERITSGLLQLHMDSVFTDRMKYQMGILVDGMGTKRIAEALGYVERNMG